jgi:hypothetical protein
MAQSFDAGDLGSEGPSTQGFDLAKPIADIFTDCTVAFVDIAGGSQPGVPNEYPTKFSCCCSTCFKVLMRSLGGSK